MSCSMCHQLRGVGEYMTEAEPRSRHHIKLGVTWVDLEESAASCETCNILVQGCRGCFLQHEIEESQISHCHFTFLYEAFEDDEETDVDKEIFFRMKNGTWFTVQIFAAPGDEYPILDSWESVPVWNRTSTRTDSDKALELARGWIDACIGTSHKLCKSPESPLLPRRVVDVGLQDGVVRLLETEGTRGTYICLSHCWGLQQIITTTRATKAAHEREIAFSALPQTFRDALLFTRRLRISYIWIDSLCIVQDDLDDWKVESAKMETIYRKAYLTIAATSSSSGAGGLYRQTPDFEVSGVSASGERYSLFFREKIDHHLENSVARHTTTPGHVDDRESIGRPTIARHPLLTRAWVYQERLLSTRVLHFGPYEVFFECRSGIQCECEGIGYFGSSETVPVTATKLVYADALGYHDVHQRLTEKFGYGQNWMSRLWRTLVSSYKGLDITNPHDLLPAIGGLAKSMRLQRGSDYLAGTWRDSLSDDLLWVIYTTRKASRPSPPSAPTWSWASVTTPSLYFDEVMIWDPDVWLLENSSKADTSKHLAEVVSCATEPDGVYEFGGIARSTLQILGAVSEGILEKEVDMRQGEPVLVYYVSFPRVRLPIKPDYLLDQPGPNQVLPGVRVSCLRMSVVREGSTETLVSLVLRTSITKPSVFERIGTLLIETRTPPVSIESGIYEPTMLRTVTIE